MFLWTIKSKGWYCTVSLLQRSIWTSPKRLLLCIVIAKITLRARHNRLQASQNELHLIDCCFLYWLLQLQGIWLAGYARLIKRISCKRWGKFDLASRFPRYSIDASKSIKNPSVSLTVNKEYYLSLVHRLRKTIRLKRPELWAWFLHHKKFLSFCSLCTCLIWFQAISACSTN